MIVYLVLSGKMIGKKETIKIVIEIDNDANALDTIQNIRKLNGFKSIAFKYKGE